VADILSGVRENGVDELGRRPRYQRGEINNLTVNNQPTILQFNGDDHFRKST
jgi:hypothetical protein